MAKVPSEIGLKTKAQLISDNDKPLAYGYVHDRDILMGKTTWEIIDLNEKINFALYFPIDTANIGKERRSLFDVLLKNIKSGKISRRRGEYDLGLELGVKYAPGLLDPKRQRPD